MSRDVVVEPPLRGEWAILNPPGHPVRAFDFLATAGRRLPYPGWAFLRHVCARISVEDTYAWGRVVVAPCDGEVVACHDGAPDRHRLNLPRDLFVLGRNRPPAGSPFQAFGGNYVILRAGGTYPLLAHLRQGSLTVRVGDRVEAGQQLGEVGNSGSSIQPHLHFQVMSDADPFPLFQNLLEFRLTRAKRRAGGAWHEVAGVALHNGDHLRF